MVPERALKSAPPLLHLGLGEELRSVLHVSPVATAISRLSDSVMVYVNPEGLAILGYDYDELVGRATASLGLWAVPDQRVVLLAQLAAEGVVRNFEFGLRVKSGAVRTAITSVFLVELDGDTCLLSMFYDITARTDLEAELREARDRFEDLARSVEDMFAVLRTDPFEYLYVSPGVRGVFGVTAEQVRADPNVLERMVHPDDAHLVESFRPVALSGQPTEVENRIVRPDGQVRWVWVRLWPILEEDGSFDRLALLVRDVTERALLLGIVDDILDFSKMEAGRLDLEEIEFDLGDLVVDVAELLAPTVTAKGLEIAVSIDPATPRRVVGDSGRLRQVLLNLAGNAAKFTDSGSVVLRARPEGELVRFEVEDTGVGIEPDLLGAIFDSFTQADRSTTRRYGGTGLGLAICRRLTAMMGGEIGCRSEPAAGSTFWFTCRLPAARPPADTEVAALAGVRALVVDDLEVNLEVLRAQLEGWGMEVTTTPSAGQALGTVREAAEQGRPFDIVLTDSAMPGLDGASLVEQLAQLPVPRPRAVVVSSVGDREELRARLGDALAAHITKPVRPSHLHDVLLDVLRGVTVQAPPASPGVRNRRGHLLVVDDNATNRIVAEAMLTRSGYTVDLAENGREAVEAVARTPYDAVLMDCEMPVLDGYAATREIRAAEGGARHTQIVALTAAAMRGDAERALAAGMDAHVAKPITFDRLHEELDRLLGQRPEVPEPDESVPADADRSVDEEPLELLLRLDPSGDLVRRIVEVFLREGSTQTEDLRAAVAAADLDGVARASHGLCGMSCAVGAVVVTAQCRSLEGLARQGVLPHSAAVDDLVRELGRASAALTAFLQGRVPAST